MDQLVLALVVVGVAVILLAALGIGRRYQVAEQPTTEAPAVVTRDRRAQPRWLQKMNANRGGFFWMPCPMCGEEFGGHEWAGTLMRDSSMGSGVCANCAEEAERLNRERFPGMYDVTVPTFHIEIRP